jgi:hypothetical protein
MPFVPDHCYALTKAGSACMARNIIGSKWCVGHARAREAMNA